MGYFSILVKNVSLSRLLVAVCLAVVVWGYVMASQYPEKTLPPITVDVAAPTAPDGLTVVPPPVGQGNTVQVILSGPVDQVSTISPSQIRPYLDLTGIKQAGTPNVPVKLKSGLPADISYKIEPTTLPVTLENVTLKTLKVEVVTQGDVNPNYYLTSPPEVSPAQITVEGRESQVNQVTKARVTLDVQNRTGPLQTVLQVQLLDGQDHVIQPIPDNLKVNPSQVNIAANIDSHFSTRTVPVRVNTEGSPATGYIAGTAKVNPPLVTLSSGDAAVLDKIDFVETQPLKIEGATSEVSGTVAIITPPDTTVIQSGKTVQVRIGIVPFQASNNVSVPVQFLNQVNSYRYDYSATTVNVTLSGPYQAFQPNLPLDKIKAMVDLADRGPGTYTLPVSIELPPDLVPTNEPTVTVKVTRPPPPPTIAPPTLAPATATTAATTGAATATPAPTTLPSSGSAGGTPHSPVPPTTAPRPTTAPITPGIAVGPAPAVTPTPTTPVAEVPPERIPPSYTPAAPTGPVDPRGEPTPRRTIAPPLTPSRLVLLIGQNIIKIVKVL